MAREGEVSSIRSRQGKGVTRYAIRFGNTWGSQLPSSLAGSGGGGVSTEAMERRMTYLKGALESLKGVFDVTVQAIGNTTEQMDGLSKILTLPKPGEVDNLDALLDEMNANSGGLSESSAQQEGDGKEKEGNRPLVDAATKRDNESLPLAQPDARIN